MFMKEWEPCPWNADEKSRILLHTWPRAVYIIKVAIVACALIILKSYDSFVCKMFKWKLFKTQDFAAVKCMDL